MAAESICEMLPTRTPTHASAATQKPGSTMNIIAMTKLRSMSAVVHSLPPSIRHHHVLRHALPERRDVVQFAHELLEQRLAVDVVAGRHLVQRLG